MTGFSVSSGSAKSPSVCGVALKPNEAVREGGIFRPYTVFDKKTGEVLREYESNCQPKKQEPQMPGGLNTKGWIG